MEAQAVLSAPGLGQVVLGQAFWVHAGGVCCPRRLCCPSAKIVRAVVERERDRHEKDLGCGDVLFFPTLVELQFCFCLPFLFPLLSSTSMTSSLKNNHTPGWWRSFLVVFLVSE